jgi:hypothetical protein
VARKYAFNPPKIRFHLNTKLPTNATGKSENDWKKLKTLKHCLDLLDLTAGPG